MIRRRRVALLVVAVMVVVVGLVVLLRKPDPDPPFLARFVRYDGQLAVIGVTNNSKYELTCLVTDPIFGIAKTILVARGCWETSINCSGSNIVVSCFSRPSRLQWIASWIAPHERFTPKRWQVTVALPPENCPCLRLGQ